MSSTQFYQRQLDRDNFSDVIPVSAYIPESNLFVLEHTTKSSEDKKDNGESYSLAFSFLSHPLSGHNEGITKKLNALVTLELPVDTMIQTLVLGSNDVNVILDNMVNTRKGCALNPQSVDILDGTFAAYRDFLKEHSQKAMSKQLKTLYRDFRICVSFVIPVTSGKKPEDADIKIAHDLQIAAQQTLETCGFNVLPMNPRLYIHLMGSLVNWSENALWRHTTKYDETSLINEQLLDIGNTLDVEPKHIGFSGDCFARTYSPKMLPQYSDMGAMFNLINDFDGNRGLPGNFIISLNILIPNQQKAKESLTSQRHAINYQTYGPLLKYVPSLSKRKEDFDNLFGLIEGGSDKVVQIMPCVILFEQTMDQLNMAESNMISYYRELEWNMLPNHHIHFPVFINHLPMCADRKAVAFLKRYKTVTSTHAVNFMPLVAEWRGTRNPTVMMGTRAGQLFNLDFFDSPTNYNALLAAESGSGKSFFTNLITMSYLSVGGRVWTFDVGRSYKKLCSSLHGDFVQFGPGRNVCLNPFPLITNIKDEGDAIFNLLAAMATVTDQFDDVQTASMQEVLMTLFDKYQQDLTIDHIAEQLLTYSDRRVSDLGTRLFSFTSKGQYGRYFVGENNVNFKNPYTVLELEELNGMEQLQQVVLLMLIFQIQQAIFVDCINDPVELKRKKLVVLDEAWALLMKGNVSQFMEVGYRRFRKANAAALVVTQSVNDLYNSKTGIVIAENSANKVMMGQTKEAIEQLKKSARLDLGDWGFAKLKTVETRRGVFSEMFINTRNGNGVARLIVPRFMQLLFSTTPGEVSAIEQRQASGMSLTDAIRDIIDLETRQNERIAA
jgi:conjugal transfer ATP-binding protein TraC